MYSKEALGRAGMGEPERATLAHILLSQFTRKRENCPNEMTPVREKNIEAICLSPWE